MATWTDDTKHSTSFTVDQRSDVLGGVGSATGLIAPPTYSSVVSNLSWTDDTKHTTVFTNDTKH